MEEIDRIADRITVLRDGRLVGTARRRNFPPTRLVAWMVGREIGEQFPARRAAAGETVCGSRLLGARPAATGGRAVDDVSLRPCARARSWAWRACRARARATSLTACSAPRARRAHGRVDAGRPALRVALARAASIRRGLALLTNDRKATGLVLGHEHRPQHHAGLAAALSPGGWLATRLEAKAAADGHARPSTSGARSTQQAGRHAVRRQPAEGGPGQVAGDQAAGAAARRADARRRRRRQARNLPN